MKKNEIFLNIFKIKQNKILKILKIFFNLNIYKKKQFNILNKIFININYLNYNLIK